jgi:hypothetical protein
LENSTSQKIFRDTPSGIDVSFLFKLSNIYRERIEIWNFVTLAGLENRPQVQMTIALKLKTIVALRPFQRAFICPILIAAAQVKLEYTYFSWYKGLSQGQIPRFEGHGSQIPVSTIFH